MTIKEIIDLLKAEWSVPAHTINKNGEESFARFACFFTEGQKELPADYPYNVPDDVKAFWSESASAFLYKDVDYGQWGIEILSPAESISYTEEEKQHRYDTYKPGELIIGRFKGDSDLLIVSCGDDDEYGNIRIGLPIDPYPEWPIVGKNFREFLEKYVELKGAKFWER
jgi:hypothetical protein